MTFEEKVREFFKVGAIYKYYYGDIKICTGFTDNTHCSGFNCGTHKFLGMCDGSIKPCFGEGKEQHCAYVDGGSDWFTLLEISNSRW